MQTKTICKLKYKIKHAQKVFILVTNLWLDQICSAESLCETLLYVRTTEASRLCSCWTNVYRSYFGQNQWTNRSNVLVLLSDKHYAFSVITLLLIDN